MTPCGSVVGIFCFHLAYFVRMNATGKSLGRLKKKKKRVPVNSSKCKRSITAKSEVTAVTV